MTFPSGAFELALDAGGMPVIRPKRISRAAFDQQRWPLCPRCEREVIVDALGPFGDEVRIQLRGCPSGCDMAQSIRDGGA